MSGLYEYHGREKGERGVARKENLDELVTAARQFSGELHLPVDQDGDARLDERRLLEEFLDLAALEAGDTQSGDGREAVQLMTLHSAKGLEFPLVFLAGVEEGLFPHRSWRWGARGGAATLRGHYRGAASDATESRRTVPKTYNRPRDQFSERSKKRGRRDHAPDADVWATRRLDPTGVRFACCACIRPLRGVLEVEGQGARARVQNFDEVGSVAHARVRTPD